MAELPVYCTVYVDYAPLHPLVWFTHTHGLPQGSVTCIPVDSTGGSDQL